jgi:hypothetical protein
MFLSVEFCKIMAKFKKMAMGLSAGTPSFVHLSPNTLLRGKILRK